MAEQLKQDHEGEVIHGYNTTKGDLVFSERKRWKFLGLPFTFTKYQIYENDISVRQGFLNLKVNDCYMYRISDVSLKMSLMQRIFRLGTVECFTSDTTDKALVLANVRNAEKIKDYILQAAEEAKMKRRTINMQNIGASDDLDPDDMHIQ